MMNSLEHYKIDVKSFVFIKAPRIEHIINARQHFVMIMSSLSNPINPRILHSQSREH